MLSLILPVQVAADAITVSTAPVITIRIKFFIRHPSLYPTAHVTIFHLNTRTMHHDQDPAGFSIGMRQSSLAFLSGWCSVLRYGSQLALGDFAVTQVAVSD